MDTNIIPTVVLAANPQKNHHQMVEICEICNRYQNMYFLYSSVQNNFIFSSAKFKLHESKWKIWRLIYCNQKWREKSKLFYVKHKRKLQTMKKYVNLPEYSKFLVTVNKSNN